MFDLLMLIFVSLPLILIVGISCVIVLVIRAIVRLCRKNKLDD